MSQIATTEIMMDKVGLRMTPVRKYVSKVLPRVYINIAPIK
jgi:hypothetical protein